MSEKITSVFAKRLGAHLAKRKKMYIQYGGAQFSRRCPKCGQFVKMAKSLSVNKFMSQVTANRQRTARGVCSHCGPVETKFKRFVAA